MTDLHPVDRREMLRRMAMLGAASAAVPALAACATSGAGTSPGGKTQEKQATGKKSADNPFGVEKGKPLDVVIFKGGFSDEYAKYDESLYAKKYGVTPKHTGTQQITGQLQTRFVNGNPPDVVDNSGAQSMDTFALIAKGQLKDMAELLAAPSIDDASKKVGDTLIPGALDPLTDSGKNWGVPYAVSINGIWHDQKLFEQKGWEVPETWDALMSLGEKIKKEAPEISPWIYQGQYPGYMISVFTAMALKHGGNEVMKAIDNLEDGAWQQQPIKDVLAALLELKTRGFIMKGTAGLTHIQSQNMWAHHKAAFIPCGSWLKSEIGSQLPADFQMAVQPTPSLDSSDKMPYDACPFSTTESFLVPAQAKNVPGGMEYLRIMLSKDAAQQFAKLTYTLTIVQGAHDDQQLDSTLKSSLDVLQAAQKTTRLDQVKYPAWYDDMGKYIQQKLGLMLTGNLTDKQFVDLAQKKADETKKDPKLKKYHR